MDDLYGNVRMVVGDDHPVYRRALARALADDPRIDLLDEVADGVSALAAIERLSPDVALLDLRMGDLGGQEIVRLIAKRRSPTRVLLISASEPADVVRRALEFGAAGFIDKRSCDEADVVSAVLRVAAGQRVISPTIQAALVDEIGRPPPIELSARERQVLGLATRGLDGRKIALELHVTHATVRTHFARIYSKLGVADRGAAIAAAMRYGMVA